MLEPLIVSTRLCHLIAKSLGLEVFRKAHDLYGQDTVKKSLLIVGDVDAEFFHFAKTLAVSGVLVRTVPRRKGDSRLHGFRELSGTDQISSLDSNQFDALFLVDSSTVTEPNLLNSFYRVLKGQASVVGWVPGYTTNPFLPEVLSSLGAQEITVTSLSEDGFPGNSLISFKTRSDQSPLFSKNK